jgi:hypothetical protein
MINRDSRGHQVRFFFLFISKKPSGVLYKLTYGISIQLSEVKFLDLLKTNYCESICQGCFH